MRNLVLTSITTRNVKPGHAFETVFLSRDALNDVEYILSSDGSLFIFAHGTFSTSISLLHTPDIEARDWFNIEFIPDTNSIICISHSGVIASVNATTLQVEEEGQVEEGIRSCAWSPDLSRLVLVTENNSMVLLSSFFDCIREITFTRCPGSASVISWRGDARSFAVYVVEDESKEGKVQIYGTDLDLLAVGRNIAEGVEESVLRGLQPAMAHSPNGSLIAIAQQLRKLQVCFIEPNGLRHGDFDIVCPKYPEGAVWSVGSMEWDPSSTILAVNLTTEANHEVLNLVQFYTRGNYHWYLKLELRDVLMIGFDTEASERVHLVKLIGGAAIVHSADLVWDVCVSGTREGSIAVIDGASVLVTPLGIACVPPPMSKFRIELSAPCRFCCSWVAFDQTHSGLGCLVGDSQLRLFRLDATGIPTLFTMIEIAEVAECNSLMMKSVEIIENHQRELWVAMNCLRYSNDRAEDSILVLQIDPKGKVLSSASRPLPGVATAVRGIGPNRFGVGILSEDSNFSVWKYSADDLLGQSTKVASFSEPCSHLSFIREQSEEDCVIVGLSKRNRLYCGEALILAGVSSYAYNRGLGVLLYVTLGTKPQLVTLPGSLLSQDHLLDENRERELGDLYDGRPVER